VVRIQDAAKKPPPSEDFVEETAARLLERSPHAADHLAAARARHLELKQMRKEGRIAELLGGGGRAEDVAAAATA